MKNRGLIIALSMILLAVLTVFLLRTKPDSEERIQRIVSPIEQSSSHGVSTGITQPTRQITLQSDPFQTLMNTPIEFYGIVLDQDSNPVVSAKVSGSVLDSWNGSPISTFTGNDGKFSIVSKGTALTLKVEKSGFYRVEKGDQLRPSTQGFDFGVEDSPRAYKPNSEAPTIFHLRKAGNPVQLDLLKGQSKVPRDGSPIRIRLSKINNLALHVGCRTQEDATQAPNAPYDWHCEIAPEGGGIQEVQDENVFIAPQEGYASLSVIDMPKNLDRKQWNSKASKSYWLRFPDYTFGRITFMMNARGDHFSVINGFRNPSANDRNLEPELDLR